MIPVGSSTSAPQAAPIQTSAPIPTPAQSSVAPAPSSDRASLSVDAKKTEKVGALPNLEAAFGKDAFAHERDLVQRALEGRPPVDGKVADRDEVAVMNDILRAPVGNDLSSQKKNTQLEAELARAQGAPFWDESRVQNMMMRAPAGIEAADQRHNQNLKALHEQVTSPVAPLL